MSKSWLLLLCLYTMVFCCGKIQANPVKDASIKFIILHNNDMHARFEQTSKNSGKCTPELRDKNECYGGFARVAYEVRKHRYEAENGGTPVLYLNAGDTYSGTPWFTVFKDNITAAFLNKLKPDAISLGNHELDNNVEGLVPFLNNVNFPVLACNLDLRKVPELAEAKHFYNSTVLNVKGVKIGIIGYLTTDTITMTPSNEIVFLEEVEAINKEAAELKAQGINILIALGHSGYEKDKEIALKCPDIDLVIGGHSNTFLYNGDQPDEEKIIGPYPTNITQESGKIVPVVQAYAYTKYLGKLHVEFDRSGNLIKFDGTPLLLTANVSREADVVQLLEKYRPNITALETTVAGHTKVFLDGRREICRTQECNLGNLMTDAMIYVQKLGCQSDCSQPNAAIAFFMPGGIRGSIEKRLNGEIYQSDILSAFPFENDLYVTKVSGKTILKSLEFSASKEPKDDPPGFLQMSGVRVVYDHNKDKGSRVTSAEVRCAECEEITYEPLVINKVYNIIVPQILLHGGDGHTFTEDNGDIPLRLPTNEYQTILKYLQAHEFVEPKIEGRITVITRN